MKIPKKLKIGIRTFKVKEVEGLADSGSKDDKNNVGC